jgi:hypothetical protein
LITRVPYRAFPDNTGDFLYCVFLNVQFSLPKERSTPVDRYECIIDSGATNCLFHADIARRLGLVLTSGARQWTNGIGGLEETWLHDVMLHLPGGPVRVTAGFKDNLSVAGLLGMRGFFEHFNVSFDSGLKECTLERIYRI